MHHWILPYPSRDTIMLRTKDGKRMWYSIIARKDELVNQKGDIDEIRGGIGCRERRERDARERRVRRQEENVEDLRWV